MNHHYCLLRMQFNMNSLSSYTPKLFHVYVYAMYIYDVDCIKKLHIYMLTLYDIIVYMNKVCRCKSFVLLNVKRGACVHWVLIAKGKKLLCSTERSNYRTADENSCYWTTDSANRLQFRFCLLATKTSKKWKKRKKQIKKKKKLL